jgi:hypothetical protein
VFTGRAAADTPKPLNTWTRPSAPQFTSRRAGQGGGRTPAGRQDQRMSRLPGHRSLPRGSRVPGPRCLPAAETRPAGWECTRVRQFFPQPSWDSRPSARPTPRSAPILRIRREHRSPEAQLAAATVHHADALRLHHLRADEELPATGPAPNLPLWAEEAGVFPGAQNPPTGFSKPATVW